MGNWWQRLKARFGMRRLDGGDGQDGRGLSRRDHIQAPPPSLHGPAQLIQALKHPNPDVRAGAARHLGEYGSGRGNEPSGDGRPFVAALLGALTDEDASVRSAAALSLGEWGAAAAGAVPALIDALAEEDDDVRSSAGIALQDIGRASRQPLERALDHPDEGVRREASAILSLMSEGEQAAR